MENCAIILLKVKEIADFSLVVVWSQCSSEKTHLIYKFYGGSLCG